MNEYLVRTYKLSVYESKKVNWPLVQTFLCSHKSTDALQTLIRPHLGVCLPSVEPLSEKRNRTTQEVQQFALRMCMKQSDANYSDLLELFATPTLADWKKYLSLCVMYNIVHDQVHFSQTYLYPDMCVDCAHNKTVNSSNHLLNPMHSSTHLYHLPPS